MWVSGKCKKCRDQVWSSYKVSNLIDFVIVYTLHVKIKLKLFQLTLTHIKWTLGWETSSNCIKGTPKVLFFTKNFRVLDRTIFGHSQVSSGKKCRQRVKPFFWHRSLMSKAQKSQRRHLSHKIAGHSRSILEFQLTCSILFHERTLASEIFSWEIERRNEC